MVCPHCGRQIADESEKCEFCGLEIVEDIPEETTAKEKKPSIILGTLGALIGSLIGGVLIILASRMAGLMGTVSTMALAALTLNLCRLFGRRLTKGTVMISMATMAVAIFLADRLDWAYRIVEWQNAQATELGVELMNVSSAFFQINAFINAGNIELSNYLTNLGFLYFFCVVGTIGTLRTISKKRKQQA